jgi:phosphatidate cytidylyltransferase
MNNFIKRTISGTIFIAVIISAILSNTYTFAVTFAIICGLATAEFHKITNQLENVNVNLGLGIFSSILLFICSFLYNSGIISGKVFSMYGLSLIIVFIYELYRRKSNPINNWAYFILGQAFIAIPFALLCSILYKVGYQPIILLAVFFTIWVNDTGAYIVGVTIGKHRLFERISPKKSWEGFFGGAVFALISGYVFSLYISEISLLNWLVLSEIIVVFSTFGDLIESLLKRTLNIKDSGNTIPGHGGILDRFDSMILAAPAVYIFLSLTLK